MSNNEAVVEVNGLTKKYGEFTALESLTLSVERGTILGLIGPNGAGKTMTIKILVGLARPTSSTARIAGVDCVRESRKIKHLVGYLLDRFGCYDNMRVHEYLDFVGAAFGIPRRERAGRIDEVLHTTGTDWMRDGYVETLSHGMQQIVGIARTLGRRRGAVLQRSHTWCSATRGSYWTLGDGMLVDASDFHGEILVVPQPEATASR